jgi:hypothetical protein
LILSNPQDLAVSLRYSAGAVSGASDDIQAAQNGPGEILVNID